MLSVAEGLSSPLQSICDFSSIDSYVNIISDGKSKKDSSYVNHICARIFGAGLEANTALGNLLVPAFVECGSLSNAQVVFNKLAYRKESAWTSLIQGYVDHEEPQHAISVFKTMQEDAVAPTFRTFVAVLKACARLKEAKFGQRMYDKIVVAGYESDPFICNIVIDMFAKCGLLMDAHDVFNAMEHRNVVTWTTMLAAYVRNGLTQEALSCLEQMQQHGVPPNRVTLLCCLRTCDCEGSLELVWKVHTDIIQDGFEEDSSIGNALVHAHATCGSLVDARDVFDELETQDVVSWTSIITGYTEHGRANEALSCFHEMQSRDVCPNDVAFACTLKACGTIGSLETGQEIHTHAVKQGVESFLIKNVMLDLYAKCGALEEANHAFDELPTRDVVAWNTLIGGYCDHGLTEEALALCEQMEAEGKLPNDVTFVYILQACERLNALERGMHVHNHIMSEGYEKDSYVCGALTDMYARVGLLSEAQAIFEESAEKNAVCWTSLMSGLVEQGLNEEALCLLEQMRVEGVATNSVTLICGLKACSGAKTIQTGQELHVQIVKRGLESEVLIGNMLVDMYAKCSLVEDGEKAFASLPTHDVISWSTLMSGYVEHGQFEKVLETLGEVRMRGILPNVSMLICGLQACNNIRYLCAGQILHQEGTKKGLDVDTCIGNRLVEMYAECGSLEEARNMFDKLPVRDVVSWSAMVWGHSKEGRMDKAMNYFRLMQEKGFFPSAILWNALIKGYGELDDSEKALRLYAQMQQQGLWPDSVTFVYVLRECSEMSAMRLGEGIHVQVYASNVFNIALATALIDMYSKCACMAKAQRVFDEVGQRDLLLWAALIAGYAQVGESTRVLSLFERMKESRIQPDGVAFLSVLSVCCHTGIVHMGLDYFEIMVSWYGIIPTMEHHTCILGLLGRAGQLDVALHLLNSLHCQADTVVWGAMLGACRKWGSVELGRYAFDQAMKAEAVDDGMYVAMCDIYKDARMWEEANEVIAMRASVHAQVLR